MANPWLADVGLEKKKRRRSRKRAAVDWLGRTSYKGARRAGKAVKPKSKHNVNLIIAGMVFGAVVDAGYQLYKGPGYNSPSPFGPKIMWGDIGQLALYIFFMFTGIGQARGDLTSFGFGLAAAKTATSIIFPSQGWSRYLLFDIKDGKLVPAWGSK